MMRHAGSGELDEEKKNDVTIIIFKKRFWNRAHRHNDALAGKGATRSPAAHGRGSRRFKTCQRSRDFQVYPAMSKSTFEACRRSMDVVNASSNADSPNRWVTSPSAIQGLVASRSSAVPNSASKRNDPR